MSVKAFDTKYITYNMIGLKKISHVLILTTRNWSPGLRLQDVIQNPSF